MFKWLVRIAATCGLLSLAGALGEFHFALDQISSFRVQYVCGLIVALAAALITRAFIPAVIIIPVLLVHSFAVAQMYIPTNSETVSGGDDIRVMSSNLLVSSTSFNAQVESIYKIDPDIIVFQEYSSSWDMALSDELKEYPFRVSEVLDSPFGIAIYSKYEIISSKIVTLGRSTVPNIDAVVNINSQHLRILGVHPPPPISDRLFNLRNSHLNAISKQVVDETRAMIVLGDLNTTPWSVHFRKMVSETKLRDSRRGFGIHPTWPSKYLFAQIPIDHILINGEIRTVDMGTVVSHGSDHKGLWADLEIGSDKTE